MHYLVEFSIWYSGLQTGVRYWEETAAIAVLLRSVLPLILCNIYSSFYLATNI